MSKQKLGVGERHPLIGTESLHRVFTNASITRSPSKMKWDTSRALCKLRSPEQIPTNSNCAKYWKNPAARTLAERHVSGSSSSVLVELDIT